MHHGATIERLGWKQGGFLRPDLAERLVAIGGGQVTVSAGSLFAVVSQSCDVVHGDFVAEPWCEVICIQQLDTINPAFEHGRNPRVLHFNILNQGIASACAVTAKDRYFLKRELLSNNTPFTNLEIPVPTLEVIANWLANRYIRPALPTEFNKRLKADQKLLKKLKTLIEKHHWLFRDFFLALQPFEEITDPKAKYRVVFLLVAPEDAFAKSGVELENFRRQFEEHLKQCTGIQVADVRLLPDTRTSLRLLDDFVPWDDFDYFTVRDEDAEPNTTAAKA